MTKIPPALPGVVRAAPPPVPQVAAPAPPAAKPEPPKAVKVVAGIITALVFLAVLAWLVSPTPSSSPATSSARAPAPVRRADLPAILTTAEQLHADYVANEVAADLKYKGRSIVVTGEVEDIAKNFMGEMVVRLSTGEMFQTVDCHLRPSQVAKAAELAKGDGVKFACIGAGMVIKSPMLRDCAF